MPEDSTSIGPFNFENGGAIDNLVLGYKTSGTLNAEKSNAIVLLPGTSQGRNSWNIFTGPGKAFDTDTYFVIVMDSIGGGLSTKPSDGLRTHFPPYTIKDKVEAQQRLLTGHFGITRAALLAGVSQGGAVATFWGCFYPDAMERLALVEPYAWSDPALRAKVGAAFAAVMAEPGWQGGNYSTNPLDNLKNGAIAYAPWLVSDAWMLANGQAGVDLIIDLFTRSNQAWDALDWVYRYRASSSLDIGKYGNGDRAALLKRVRAKTLVLPCASDVLLPAKTYARPLAEAIPGAHYIEIPSTRGHLGGLAFSEAEPEYVFATEVYKELLAR